MALYDEATWKLPLISEHHADSVSSSKVAAANCLVISGRLAEGETPMLQGKVSAAGNLAHKLLFSLTMRLAVFCLNNIRQEDGVGVLWEVSHKRHIS